MYKQRAPYGAPELRFGGCGKLGGETVAFPPVENFTGKEKWKMADGGKIVKNLVKNRLRFWKKSGKLKSVDENPHKHNKIKK